MSQLTDEHTPTAAESRLLLSYWNETNHCRTRFLHVVSKGVPEAATILAEANSETEAYTAMLIERQTTWGKAAQRAKANQETTAAKLRRLKG